VGRVDLGDGAPESALITRDGQEKIVRERTRNV